MSNYFRAYSLRYPRHLVDLQKAGDPDIRFEIFRKGSPTQHYVYTITSPVFACQARSFRFAQIGDSYLCYQPSGNLDGACLDEGLLLLTPRDCHNLLLPLPSRREVANMCLATGKAKTVQPLEEPEFYSAPADFSGLAYGKVWNLWRW